MKKISTLTVLVFYIHATAQSPCFNTGSGILSGNVIQQVTSADFDKDGKIDFASANSNTNNITVALAASIPTSSTFTVGASPYSICTADFNNDGMADLATANPYANTIAVLLGTGTGSFGSPLSFGVSGSPSYLITTDFNMDGNADLAIANGTGTYFISILLGNGAGSFNNPAYPTVPNGCATLLSADFNGDTKPDLAVPNVTNSGSQMLIYLGNGAGSFGSSISYSLSSLPNAYVSNDFNNDGKVDIALNFSNNIEILQGKGNGSFLNDTVFSTIGFMGICAGDFDLDGNIDLATTDGVDVYGVYPGTGTGHFKPIFTAQCNCSGPAAVMSTDLNNDHKPDLAITVNNGASLYGVLNCAVTATCVASIKDSLFSTSPLNWTIVPHYSPQVTNAVWYWGDGSSTTGLYPSHSYAITGWYDICVTVYSSCGDSASICRGDSLYRTANNSAMIYVNVGVYTTGVDKLPADNNQVVVYPNPSKDQFSIETNTADKLIVDLLDVNGRKVWSKEVSNKTSIDISDLREGIYTLSIQMTNSVINKKLVIMYE